MKRFLVEFAMGTDLHGQNVTKAACKAVRNAISNCCLCGISDCLGIEDLDNRMSNTLSILEPTLVIALSLVVGFILLSVMLPLVGIMSSI